MAARRLPKEGEPLRLPDGTFVEPARPQRAGILQYISVPSNSEAQRIVAKTKRKLSDLPAIPKQCNIASVILMYQLFGLGDEEIAIATGLTAEQVVTVIATPVFAELQKTVVETVLEADMHDVRMTLKRGAKTAADKMVGFLDHENEGMQLAAAKDILDRSGHKAADVVHHQHMLDGALRIEVIDKRVDDTMPTLDLSAERN